MLDDLVDPLGREQPPVSALMPGLSTPLAAPTPSRPVVSAPMEDPVTAAATSSANSDSDDARAPLREPRAARSPRPDADSPQPTRRAEATTPQPTHDHHPGSPRPQPAPHTNVRRRDRGPFPT